MLLNVAGRSVTVIAMDIDDVATQGVRASVAMATTCIMRSLHLNGEIVNSSYWTKWIKRTAVI